MKGPQKHVDKGVVYQIPCAQCDEVYVGETGRPLKTRITEHKRAVSTGDVWNANAVHCMKTNHSMDWNAAGVVDRASRWRERRIKESVHIRKRKTFNMDSGFPPESSVELLNWTYRGLNINIHLIGQNLVRLKLANHSSLCMHKSCHLFFYSQFCMPDEARDGRNVALIDKCFMLYSIVQRRIKLLKTISLFTCSEFLREAREYVRMNAKVKGSPNMISKSFAAWVVESWGHEIHEETARQWLHKLRLKAEILSKGVHFDCHERDDIVTAREKYLSIVEKADLKKYGSQNVLQENERPIIRVYIP